VFLLKGEKARADLRDKFQGEKGEMNAKKKALLRQKRRGGGDSGE